MENDNGYLNGFWLKGSRFDEELKAEINRILKLNDGGIKILPRRK